MFDEKDKRLTSRPGLNLRMVPARAKLIFTFFSVVLFHNDWVNSQNNIIANEEAGGNGLGPISGFNDAQLSAVNLSLNVSQADASVSDSGENVPLVAVANQQVNELWTKIRHLQQKVRLKENQEVEVAAAAAASDATFLMADMPFLENEFADDPPSRFRKESVEHDEYTKSYPTNAVNVISAAAPAKNQRPAKAHNTWPNVTSKTYRLLASGSRKSINSQATAESPDKMLSAKSNRKKSTTSTTHRAVSQNEPKNAHAGSNEDVKLWNAAGIVDSKITNIYTISKGRTTSVVPTTEDVSSSPNLVNKFHAFVVDQATADTGEIGDGNTQEGDNREDDQDLDNFQGSNDWPNDPGTSANANSQFTPDLDIVTKFLLIVESQSHGNNCTAGTNFSLGEGVVDRYAQDRFRLQANIAVNQANWLTRLWKYADPSVLNSEYFLHSNLFRMLELDEDIFAAGNCYDKHQYKDYVLFCPFAYRLLEGPILAKDLAIEYNYLGDSSEFFYIARQKAERVIRNMTSLIKGELEICTIRIALSRSSVHYSLFVDYAFSFLSSPSFTFVHFDCSTNTQREATLRSSSWFK